MTRFFHKVKMQIGFIFFETFAGLRLVSDNKCLRFADFLEETLVDERLTLHS